MKAGEMVGLLLVAGVLYYVLRFGLPKMSPSTVVHEGSMSDIPMMMPPQNAPQNPSNGGFSPGRSILFDIGDDSGPIHDRAGSGIDSVPHGGWDWQWTPASNAVANVSLGMLA